jgi:phosphoenolpyruvate carboxylase
MLEDVHRPLRDDVRLLGELLGDVLQAREGTATFQLVEEVRALAKQGRAGSDTDFARLTERLAGMPIDSALPIARAFAHFLSLANIAEQHHRIRRRRAYRRATSAPQPGSCEQAFSALLARGVEPGRLRAAVRDLRIELVLTAHPTEVVRRSLAMKHDRIAALLTERDASLAAGDDGREVVEALRREILAVWETDEIRHTRPTPIDEARAGLLIVEQTLWDVVPRYARIVDRLLVELTGAGLPKDAAPIRFGSWMGGDRDGNPHVTAAVTRQVVLLARWMAAGLYHREIDRLAAELSMSAASAELSAAAGGSREPYRAVLRPLCQSLARWREQLGRALARAQSGGRAVPHGDSEPFHLGTEDVRAPLELCERSLRDTGLGAIADGRLTDILRRLAAFGVSLVRLDIRQSAERHAEALDAVTSALGLGRYLAWSEPERQQFLCRELENARPLIPAGLAVSADVREVLDTFAAIADLPPDSLGTYVISMAARPSDVLAVQVLQKASGVAVPLPAVPLFETADTLAAAGGTLSALLDMPAYRARIGGRQHVMIGYSDSARDIGRFSAAWALFRAQEEIVASCRARGVSVTLFHGRGGSVGRGGGPTAEAIRAQPAGSIDGTLRVTEQGEMIHAKFGLVEIALRTLELYTSATIEKTLVPDPPVPAAWRQTMDAIAARAKTAYRATVYDDERFPAYFSAATPEAVLAALNVGSRPARRQPEGGVAGLRAIPWQFAWTQTRLLLASWLGLEAALDHAREAGLLPRLAEMHRAWPFLRVTFDLMEMVLAKADARVASQYDQRLVPADLRPIGEELRTRLARAASGVLEVSGHKGLLDEQPVLRRSIDVRNPYVDPINVVQVELLRRLRAGDDRVMDALMVTINGISAGMRNTG